MVGSWQSRSRRIVAGLTCVLGMGQVSPAAENTPWFPSFDEFVAGPKTTLASMSRASSGPCYECPPAQGRIMPAPQATPSPRTLPAPESTQEPSQGENLPSPEPTPEATPETSTPPVEPDLASEQFAGLGSNTMNINDSVGGYIDNPIVGTWFRLRYDQAWNMVAPDRAEFFYAKCGCFGPPAAGPVGPNNSNADKVNYRDISPYFELQIKPRLSVFAEVPVRFIDINFAATNTGPNGAPQINGAAQNGGLADMNAGFKYAVYTDAFQYLTVQLKIYAPTGNAALGLGNNHVSIEPGLLYLGRMTERLYLQGELRQWVPAGGSDFAGNVFRWGVGLGFDLVQPGDGSVPANPYISPGGLRITSVTEFVGWSISGGQQFTSENGQQSANGMSIINVKQGVRFTEGRDSLYVGWGHALTEQTWYSDLFRLEYRRMF